MAGRPRGQPSARGLLAGELSPGEQIRQADWAERLGVSRVPIREALKALAPDGLLNYDHNRGYFVVRFGPHQMIQIYRMRRLLETEPLRTIEWPDAEQFARFERLGHEASARMQAGDFEADILADASFSRGLQAVSGGRRGRAGVVCAARHEARGWRKPGLRATADWHLACRARADRAHAGFNGRRGVRDRAGPAMAGASPRWSHRPYRAANHRLRLSPH
ncbi:MAG: GntR family transcriptional regulator [Chloroflexi bacterium]|nr:GntR family transcriptional regulator [Chloroflexota bacterium]